jgi:hypothetical protein
MPEIFIAPVVLLVTVTVLPLLVVPTKTLVNDKVAGEKVNGTVPPEEPLPERAMFNEPEVYVIDRAPAIRPLYVGLKVTVIVQCCLASKLVPQGDVPLPATE